MNIKLVSGNFAIVVAGSVAADKQEAIDKAGITSVAHREGLSKVYSALIPDDAEGSAAKRNAVEFNDENAAEFSLQLETVLKPYGFAVESVTRHEAGEGAASPMVRATYFVDTLSATPDSEKTMRGMFALQGLENAADATKEELVAFAHKKGLGMQPPKAAKNGS